MQALTNSSEIFLQPYSAFSFVMGEGRRLPRESGAFGRYVMKKKTKLQSAMNSTNRNL